MQFDATQLPYSVHASVAQQAFHKIFSLIALFFNLCFEFSLSLMIVATPEEDWEKELEAELQDYEVVADNDSQNTHSSNWENQIEDMLDDETDLK